MNQDLKHTRMPVHLGKFVSLNTRQMVVGLGMGGLVLFGALALLDGASAKANMPASYPADNREVGYTCEGILGHHKEYPANNSCVEESVFAFSRLCVGFWEALERSLGMRDMSDEHRTLISAFVNDARAGLETETDGALKARQNFKFQVEGHAEALNGRYVIEYRKPGTVPHANNGQITTGTFHKMYVDPLDGSRDHCFATPDEARLLHEANPYQGAIEVFAETYRRHCMGINRAN